MLTHWSQFVPNMSADIRGHEALRHHLFLSEFRRCVKIGVAVLASPSLIVLMVSVDAKQNQKKKKYHFIRSLIRSCIHALIHSPVQSVSHAPPLTPLFLSMTLNI